MDRLSMELVVTLQDNARGSIEVRKDARGNYVLWLEMMDIGGSFWECDASKRTLNDAMMWLAWIIEQNVRNDFYDGGE